MTEFERRRKNFVEKMGDGVAVFPSAPAAVRSNDTDYEYRQDSDLYFLSGFEEPQSVLVLAPNHPQTKSVLFLRPRDREREIWEGRRVGVENAPREFGIDAAYPIDELEERLPQLLDTSDRLYYAFSRNEEFNARIVRHLKHYHVARRQADRGPVVLTDPSAILHELRVRKSPADVERLKRAVAISREGHTAAMRHSRPGMYEYEIEAILEYTFHRMGAQAAAYPSIVAGGANATILHYTSNRQKIADGALVLVDAGAELDYYCGDITRTWPIGGRFSAEQRAIYEIVLEAQRRALELCRPGSRFSRSRDMNGAQQFDPRNVHHAATAAIIEGLLALRLLQGSFEENFTQRKYHQFFMHGTGHWLGMDTHDVGYYRLNGDWRALEPGMVITVEPGVYVAEDAQADERFRGIGVRIEDDVLITNDGCEILSAGTPTGISEVERTIAQGRESQQPLIA